MTCATAPNGSLTRRELVEDSPSIARPVYLGDLVKAWRLPCDHLR